VVTEYLSAVAEDQNPAVFVAALGEVAKARGMAQIAKMQVWAGRVSTKP
jgi:probable addiction module antidote protein